VVRPARLRLGRLGPLINLMRWYIRRIEVGTISRIGIRVTRCPLCHAAPSETEPEPLWRVKWGWPGIAWAAGNDNDDLPLSLAWVKVFTFNIVLTLGHFFDLQH
jgi:hypothetical protein